MRVQDTEGARAVFQEAREHGVRPGIGMYRAFIQYLARNFATESAAAEVFRVFSEMQAEGLKPDGPLFEDGINAWIRAGCITDAFDALKLAEKRGFQLRQDVYLHLLDLCFEREAPAILQVMEH